MSNLASTYGKMGKFKEALALCEEVVEKYRVFPSDHTLKGTKLHIDSISFCLSICVISVVSSCS
jgi:hypothetical protein